MEKKICSYETLFAVSGNLAEDVEELRHAHLYSHYELEPSLAKVFDSIHQGMFGDADRFSGL